MARRVLPEKPPELAPHGCRVGLTAMVPCRSAAPHPIRGLVPVVEAMKSFGESWPLAAGCEELLPDPRPPKA